MSFINQMAVKVLVNSIGQHIVADTKQVENKESKEIVGYWLKDPRIGSYSRDEGGNINVSFAPFCIMSDEKEFSYRANDVVAILEPRQDVIDSYNKLTAPPTTEITEVTTDEVEPATTEVG